VRAFLKCKVPRLPPCQGPYFWNALTLWPYLTHNKLKEFVKCKLGVPYTAHFSVVRARLDWFSHHSFLPLVCYVGKGTDSSSFPYTEKLSYWGYHNMYLTQEFKNRAENLIGIENSHGQHPCPFWKFLHREYRPFGNIFWYLDRDLDWDLQRSRGRPGLRKRKNMRLFSAHDSELLLSVFAPFPVR
jgi:hypothetical protein